MSTAPKVKTEASNERRSGAGDVERYERLRARALSGEPDGFRLGLAMLERRGMVAWARAWQTTAPPRPALAAGPTLGAPSDAREIVGVLAGMALAAVAGR